MTDLTLVLVGCGNMGFAMLEGWLEHGFVDRPHAHIIEPAEPLRERAASLGVRVYSDVTELPADLVPTIVVLAVKPQVMADVAPHYRAMVQAGAACVSVAAGITVDALARDVGENAAIIRVMPNTPSAVGKGMMVMYSNSNVSEIQMEQVAALMSASGDVASIDDEALMDAVTAVSGSGPAYVFYMIEALRDAGIEAGLPDELAAHLAMQTVYGAAAYAKQSGQEPGLLRQQVTSPNGTTQAALEVLMDTHDGLTPLMTRAVKASRDRSRQLGK